MPSTWVSAFFGATSNASTTNAAKGTLNTSRQTFTIAANDQISDTKTFEEVILAYRNGAPIRVSMLARREDRSILPWRIAVSVLWSARV